MSLTELTALPTNESGRDFFPGLTNRPMNLAGLPGIYEADLKEAFDEIDFDQNGFIGASELRYMLMLIGENPSDKEINEMLCIVDCGDGKASRVGDTVRVTSDRDTLKRSFGVLGILWDESMSQKLDTLQIVVEVLDGGLLGLQPHNVKDSWRYEWVCQEKVVKKEASYGDFLRIMEQSSPVPKEMALIMKEASDKHDARVFEEEKAKAEVAGHLSKSEGSSVRDVDLILKVASGFLYMGKSPTLERERTGSHLPQTREKEEGRSRALPTKMAPPLALSPRAMRNAKRLRDQGALDKGKGKGKGKDGGILPRGIGS